MDKFQENMKEMQNMSEDDKKQQIQKIQQQCICPDCPSYNDCAKGKNELAYCATGKSPGCITEEKGCVCPNCPVTEMMGLQNTYFCTRGTEKE